MSPKRYGYDPDRTPKKIKCHCGLNQQCSDDCDRTKNYGLKGGHLSPKRDHNNERA